MVMMERHQRGLCVYMSKNASIENKKKEYEKQAG